MYASKFGNSVMLFTKKVVPQLSLPVPHPAASRRHLTASRMAQGDLWKRSEIRGFLSDISGVLFNTGEGGGTVVPGSVDAVKRLKAAGVPIRFVTNETSCTHRALVAKLQRFGYPIQLEEVFPPAPVMVRILRERGLRPQLLVSKELLDDFAGVDTSNPNCLVMSDVGEELTFSSLNKAFQLLMTLDKPHMFSLGIGKYYRTDQELTLDVGCFTKGLEYSTGLTAEVVGKPSKTFFEVALKGIGLPPEQVIMIGDDIDGDVGGGQACGMYGVQVRTGKYRPSDEHHPRVKPDAIVNNLAEAVDKYLAGR